MNPSTLQTICQIIIVIGILFTALGGYGSYHFGKEIENKKITQEQIEQQNERLEIVSLLRKHTERIKAIRDILLFDMYFTAVTQNNGAVEWPKSIEGSSFENYYPDQDSIKKLTDNIPLNKIRFEEKNWIYRLDRVKNQTIPLCESTLKLSNYLTANETSLIGQLMTCDLFAKLEDHKKTLESGTKIANENITFLEPEIREYLMLTEKVDKEILKEITNK
ncbi:hypothetical protein [Tenacibaculum crassostreae]|uniref:hypothetical protein n=1 Tax=Tenacibaculum crassostreae TaxID=502683 RepID=UPI0038935C98